MKKPSETFSNLLLLYGQHNLFQKEENILTSLVDLLFQVISIQCAGIYKLFLGLISFFLHSTD